MTVPSGGVLDVALGTLTLDDYLDVVARAALAPTVDPSTTRTLRWRTPALGEVVDEGVQTVPLCGQVRLMGCRPATGVELRLLSTGGDLLHEHIVDVLPYRALPPAHVDRRVCADGAVDVLSGGEKVGAPLTATEFGLTGPIRRARLTDVTDDGGSRFFFSVALANGSAQVKVTELGASDQGLAPGAVYPLTVLATDGAVERGLDLGVWLATTTLAIAGDGICGQP